MAYSTLADILERLPEEVLVRLTDDADQGQVDTAVVERAIADADAEIDGYVGTRYSVPLSPVPDLVRKLSVELSIYHLFSRRRGAPEEWRQRYEDAIRLLRDLAAGRVSLGTGEPSGTPTGSPVHATSQGRWFTRSEMEDF